MTFAASVITLYPEMFPGPLGVSLAGKAMEQSAWSLETIALRDFGRGKHKNVDDTPAGGGAGMVLRADVLADAVDSIGEDSRPRLLMSPRGRVLDQKYVRELAQGAGAVIICGRFEGVDQRVIEARGLTEVSVGDYILSGGELAALTLLDAVVRLLPGVMGNAESGETESFETGLLEHPQYTRPADFEGMPIPEVLTSGNHKKIAEWQHEQAKRLTRERRPDLAGPKKIIPAFPVGDIEKGIGFYRDMTGFACIHHDVGYAVMAKGAIQLHLWLANDESWRERKGGKPIVSGAESFLAGTHSCRIEISDVKACHDKMKRHKIIHPNGDLKKTPWNSIEFSILDPWGNLVTFFEWI